MEGWGIFVLLFIGVGVWMIDDVLGKIFWWWIICLIGRECDIDGWWFE